MINSPIQPDKMLNIYIGASEIMQHGVMWLGEEGHIIDVNPRFAKDLGYTKEDFKPKSIFEVNPNMTLLSWRRLWAELLENRQINLETEQITADDIIYSVNMRGVLIEADEKPVCMGIVDNLNQVNRYQDLLNLTSKIGKIGSWELDVATNDFILSEEMFRLLGLPKIESLKFEDFKDILGRKLHKEKKNELLYKIEEALTKGGEFEMEMAIEQQAGEFSQFRIFVKTAQESGKTTKISGVLQDISTIGGRTDELYFMKFCMDNASHAIFWADKEGKISYANKAASELYGYTQEEMLGMHPEQFTTTSGFVWSEQFDLLKERSGIRLKRMHKSKSGELIPIVSTNHYLEHRGQVFVCSFIKDHRKEAAREEKLLLANETFQNSNDLIVWLNSDTTFRYINNTFAKKVGYSEKELEGKSLLEFIPTTTLENFKKGWDSLRSGKKMVAEREIIDKNGEKTPVEMTVSLVKVVKKEYAAVVFRDISKEKERLAELHNHAEEIERLNNNLTEENISLKEEMDFEYNFSNIISTDPAYKKVLRQVAQVADTDATVLILGETGTGKELLARATHELSDRCDMPMIKVNCGALPENLIESELFGHEKGAFTGASAQKLGKFERADKGTIFLDEIGELPLDLQTQLLRVLQEGEIERVGGTKTLKIDVRIIAATNRNLEQRVAEGKFRADLYYRLNVFPIINLPLRERLKDIPVLVRYFIDKFNKRFGKDINEIPPNVLKSLNRYDFPGNIRELENMIERAVIISKSNVLAFDYAMLQSEEVQFGKKSKKFLTLDQAQTAHIIEALKRTKGKVSGDMGAAAILDMNDKTLVSRMKKLGIDKRDYLKK